ncbi:hypothetical protein O181_012274 [Austropuccinia psidii MF-1]|uniref:Uncharacterized protein n=1 Tax=Austropuccinia psidii MF-1 TaxID=1389203 RepID=A0A9Q3BUD6_9BASI|nr:hypothetical protein [Austropuccinia psidii MF-1]
MNPISQPSSTKLRRRDWNVRLGHARDKTMLSFRRKHVPSLDPTSWQPFFCEVCVKGKCTHYQVQHWSDIPKDKALDLLFSDIMGPFNDNPLRYLHILTIHDNVSTYRFVFPLKTRKDAPAAILEKMKHLQVKLWNTLKVLHRDNV